MSVEGEVETRINEMTEYVFEKYNPGNKNVNAAGEPYILKEHLKAYIEYIME
jgi:hypothetical protein